MEEEKMILNDGQYDEQYDLEIKTHQISVSADVLADKGWYKLADDEQVVKKAVLSKEETEWFEKYKVLPFFDDGSDNFSRKAFDKSIEYLEDWDKQSDFLNRLSQAYFTGYTIKEKKYYIKLNFNDYGANYLGMDDDGWFWDNPTDFGDYPTWFTQEEINQMQKDPQAKGLDLNALKVEVPEDELED